MRLSGFAPAKVNLFLHVGPVDADGYHPLASLMSFADIGDEVSLAPAERFGFDVRGPFAKDLAGDDPASNLVWRAADRLFDRARVARPPLALTLTKALPVAAGLGGGSCDAGAAMRLLRDALELDVVDDELEAIAAELGADGPACLAARPLLAQGRGERLSPAPALPVLPAVLVNPRVVCSTGKVYRTFDRLDVRRGAEMPALAARYDTVEAVVAALAVCRNDLEQPAMAVTPVIKDVLSVLQRQPQTLIGRLSGSGATTFALCATILDAHALAKRVEVLRPSWWVRPCRLGGPWPDDRSVHETVSHGNLSSSRA